MEPSPELIRAMLTVCRVLNELAIPYCLIGGLAVSMLATPRATGDIDLAVLIDAARRKQLLAELQRSFVIVQDKPLMKLERATIWRLVLKDQAHADELVIVDFVLADKPVYARALSDPATIEIDGTRMQVARPEKLLAIKEFCGRPQDIADAQSLRDALEREKNVRHELVSCRRRSARRA